ncbi:MAG: nucleotidyltransferase domain-containing protein [Treponema sp.]|nr:nucleotidyltransferase domain-containing protein [Treponema sp.]
MELNVPVRYRQDIENVTKLLKGEGCEAVYLFGSLVTGKINENSDIDIGIKGYPEGKFFKIYSKIYFNFDNNIDLVDFDTNNDFYLMLKKIGEIVQLG